MVNEEEKKLYKKLQELSMESLYVHRMFSIAFHSNERYAMMELIIKMNEVIREQTKMLIDAKMNENPIVGFV